MSKETSLMKKKALGISLILSGFALTLGAFLVPQKEAKKAYAVHYSSTLPTTIKFNDNTESEIRSYYSALNNLTETERSGTNLLKNLRDIIHDNITYYPYGNIGSAGVTQIYTITDRDWTNSPISSISSGTYNPTLNQITNYSHSQEKDNNPYITMLYVDYERNGPTRFLNGTAASFDKEHVWSQSHGFKAQSGATGPAGTDLHHLIAGEKAVNQQFHSNSSYGNVKVASKEAAEGEASTIAPKFIISGNKIGTPVHTSSEDEENVVFEPNDADKGRIARALLYMAACYNNYSGNESFSDFDPNLVLVDHVIKGETSVGSSETNPAPYGILSDLLEWNRTFKPTPFEIHRNNLIYNNYQFNRNPFIDFPEWADFIWGNAESGYQSTGYAQPLSDTINDYNDPSGETVAVTGVSVSPSSTSIEAGKNVTLTATVSPSNATNKNVTWTSSDTTIATVSGGIVTGVAKGNATITATTSDGGYTATCSVTVTKPSGPTEASYIKVSSLSALDSGNYVIAADTSSSLKGMTYNFSSSKYSGTNVTATNNVISESDGNSIKFALTVSGSGNSRTVVVKDPNANKYVAYGSGTNLSQNTDSYSWTVSAGTKGTFRFTSQTSGRGLIYRLGTYNYFGGFSTSNVTAGGQEYYDLELFKYTEAQTTKSLDSITLDTSNVPILFNVGDTFSYEGLTVTANYDDGTDDIVTPTSVSTPSLSSAGQKTVTVSYTEGGVTKTATYTITVTANPSISWTAPTINVYSGSTLSGTDVNAWAVTYNDGSGHQTVLTYSQLTVKLGGTTISIPHTWVAADDGKTLTATYSSLTTSESSAVQITQSVNPIMKTEEPSSKVSDLTFTAACGGSGTADDGKTWTVTSDAAESNFDGTKGIHYGTGSAAVEYIQLVSDSFTSGTITQVVVNASGASGVTGSVSVTVGGNAFGEVQSFNSTASDKTFTGSASAGRIVVRVYKASAAVKAIYCKSVKVTYTTSGSSVNIANSLDHIAAQRVAVKFAKAFNAAMDTTSGCTTNLSSAWSTCSSAYDTFLSEADALGSAEEAYAKDLIKYATVQYSDDSGEACIERMMKTYEVCVQKHKQTPFMNELVELGKAPTSVTTLTLNNATNITIIVVASVIMIAAVGGYFYIRRYKQK